MKEKMDERTPMREECFGDFVNGNYVLLQQELSVKQAMRTLVEKAGECEDIDMLFVADEAGRYRGAIELKSLITAREGTPLTSLIDGEHPFVYATRPIDENVEKLQSFAGATLPVLDEDNRMLGIISVEGMLDILTGEMEEDYARLGGLSEGEELQESLAESMKKRLPWLAVLLVLGLFISSVIGVFERVIEQLTVVVCFQSLILGMAGNGGTQSLAVTVRLLSGVPLTKKERRRLINKEIGVGFVNGGMLAAFSFLGIGLYLFALQGEAFWFAFAVSGCIGVALWCAMTISAAAGTLIPLMFKGLGLDPAVASGPLITTLNDLAAVVIYYGLAWLMLIQIGGFGN